MLCILNQLISYSDATLFPKGDTFYRRPLCQALNKRIKNCLHKSCYFIVRCSIVGLSFKVSYRIIIPKNQKHAHRWNCQKEVRSTKKWTFSTNLYRLIRNLFFTTLNIYSNLIIVCNTFQAPHHPPKTKENNNKKIELTYTQNTINFLRTTNKPMYRLQKKNNNVF